MIKAARLMHPSEQIYIPLSFIFFLLVLCSGCAATKVQPPEPLKSDVVFVQYGNASYYGEAHQGKLTASGEPFDMWKYTAAHRKLEFGTHVRVTNLKNGTTVIVRINDRGPFAPDRIIDLSYAAAKAISMIPAGVAPVSLEVLK